MSTETFLHRAIDLSAPAKPLSWTVENFAASELLTLVAGQPGTAKTQLGLQIVEAVANGGTVCGLAVTPGRALYLDAENGEMILRDRQRAGNLRLPPRSCLDMRGEALHTPEARKRLAATIVEAEATLVVLDSLTRLRGPLKENDTDDMAHFIGELASVGRETGAAIILLHHRSTKGGAANTRGASAIEDQSDIIFTLTRHGNGYRRTLANTKMRVGPEWAHKLNVELHAEPLKLVAEGEASFSLPARVRTAIGSGASFAEIGAAVEIDTANEVGRKRLQRTLDKLIDAEEVERIAKGQYALSDVPSQSAQHVE